VIYHAQLDVDGAQRFCDAELLSLFPQMAPSAARAMLAVDKAMGVRFISFGGCDNFDPVNGCKGHPSEQGETNGR
jgi:hypothetical protein